VGERNLVGGGRHGRMGTGKNEKRRGREEKGGTVIASRVNKTRINRMPNAGWGEKGPTKPGGGGGFETPVKDSRLKTTYRGREKGDS